LIVSVKSYLAAVTSAGSAALGSLKSR